MKKGAIFDVDGLIFDTERIYEESWIKTMEFFDLEPDYSFPPLLCGVNGPLSRQIIHEHFPTMNVEDFINVCFARAQHIMRTTPLVVKPGVEEILQFLKDSGIKISIGSGSRREQIIKNLKATGLLDYFDQITTSYEVDCGKPYPEFFIYAAKQLDLPPEDCYVLEDSPLAIRNARIAGCSPIMIPDLAPADDQTIKACDGIYETLFKAMEAMKRGEI